MEGPSWVGLGVHRSGTTWFTDLLIQHPEVTLTGISRRGGGRKELHFFDAALARWNGEQTIQRYRQMFESPLHAGEFTPDYLRCNWIPPLMRDAAPNAIFLVLLRDPVERFVSAMQWRLGRYAVARPDERMTHHWVRSRGADAVWAGMYASQLAVWTSVLPQDRFVVQQYEHFKADPQAAVDRVWRTLGLEPVPLEEVSRPSITSTPGEDKQLFDLESVPGLREMLLVSYRPEVARLVDEWGVDTTVWPHFAG